MNGAKAFLATFLLLSSFTALPAAEPIDIGSRQDPIRLKVELKDADLYSFRFIK